MRTKLVIATAIAGLLNLFSHHSAAATVIESERHQLQLNTIAEGLEFPWGMAFLPDGSLLVTERGGNLRRLTLNGDISAPIAGVPKVVAQGQGGLLDVVLDPDYANNQFIYLSYAEPAPAGAAGSSTAVARAKFDGNQLTDVKVLFSASPKWASNHHFGSRLVFSADGEYLFITLGDRGNRRDDAQALDNHNGKVLRIHKDGRVPIDNPFVNQPGAVKEIWSWGHRNVQGAALHPDTGELWTNEHGPKGGDEINIARAGANYGWPIATFGINYDNSIITPLTAAPRTEQPHYYWLPSIAVSNMLFYSGDAFPAWQGDLLVTALRGSVVARLDLDGERIMHEERLFGELNARLRDIEQGPDGYLYLLTDERNGKLIQVKPAK